MTTAIATQPGAVSKAAISDSETAAPMRMSYEDFLQRCDGIFAEWVEGEVLLTMSCSDEHQDLQRFLLKLIDTWVEIHKLGVVRGAPLQMKLSSRPSGREPDVLFLAQENLSRLQKTYLDGPADLVVEIVSPESQARDRGDKFYEYETAGIAEYWLIDPERKRSEFYQSGEDGLYALIAPDAGGIYRSRAVTGLWLREAWLWQRPILLDILREWKLI